MNIFILDDTRTIDGALNDSGYGTVARLKESGIDPIICLARPFRSLSAGPADCGFDTPIDIITSNPKFDLWILDNDLGIDPNGVVIEGYTFLRIMVDSHPDLVPDVVVSCSANQSRRADIIAFHRNWMKSRE